MIYKELINNIALVIILSALYTVVYRQLAHRLRIFQVITGIFFGVIAVMGMTMPLHLLPGIIFDGRSVIISAAGLFGGPLSAVIASIFACLYRLWIGGAGGLTGTGAILTSAGIGVSYYYLRRSRPDAVKYLHLYTFGIIVHLVIVLLMLTFPSAIRFKVIKDMSIPVLLIFPVATLIVCRLMLGIESQIKTEQSLRRSEERFSTFMDHLPAAVFMKDSESRNIYFNKYMADLYGANEEWIGKSAYEVLPEEIATKMIAEDKKVLSEGSIVIEQKIPDKDGVEHIFHTYKFAIEGEGKPKMLGGFALDITARRRAEDKIKASLKEKKVLLQEIHHRVRNNMQVVSSLLKLQAGEMKDEKIRQAFKESQRRVSAMAQVHETLYKSDSMADIELQKHIPALVDSVYRSFRIKQKVALQVDVEEIKLSIDQASPLSLVINELISNSLQHAFPKGKGEIAINVRLREDNEIEVMISDNGPGMPEGIDSDESLGLQLIKGLVESQLEGTWDINTEGGTKHTIRFKKKEWAGPSGRLNIQDDS